MISGREWKACSSYMPDSIPFLPKPKLVYATVGAAPRRPKCQRMLTSGHALTIRMNSLSFRCSWCSCHHEGAARWLGWRRPILSANMTKRGCGSDRSALRCRVAECPAIWAIRVGRWTYSRCVAQSLRVIREQQRRWAITWTAYG